MAAREQITEQTVVQRTKSTTLVCDSCGAESNDGRWNWGGGYEHDSVKLSLCHKTYYPEGGGEEGVTFDCCPKCFVEKVAPALESLGFKKRETSW